MGSFSNEISVKRSLTLSDFTLRNHKKGITALQIIRLTSLSNIPVLLSGDSNGYFVMWNLVTKRPITCLQIEGHPHIIAFEWVGTTTTVLCILCKDSMLRMYRLETSVLKSLDLVRKQNQFDKKEDIKWSKFYEMPINTLNFANFIMDAQVKANKDSRCYRLICCHTDDSEAIDIYQIAEGSKYKLQRPFSNINFSKFLKEQNFLDLPNDSKFGIIMRFVKLDHVVFLGFENGFIIGFTTIFDEDLQKDIVEVVHVSDDHYPNPILNMCVSGNTLYSCSTDDVIARHKLSISSQPAPKYLKDSALLIKCASTLRISEPAKIRLPLKKISHIDKISDKYLLVSSWSGITVVLNIHTLEVLHTFMKSKNNVVVNDSSMGDLTNGSSTNTESSSKFNNYKVGAMTVLKSFDVQADGLKLGEHRRIKALAECDWCLIGYDDGTIKLNKI
ncbi:hypothetical protein SMKI_16G2440 [Saccharomyces mikatae IFO 1815]|uniref:ASTRA-associated protein 1 n=1 Tax=Saccharomyces mikatae IFO 1815 TaxID=226126 RepID=A0AA35NDR0_SACMI|nr:uncharacterized protein SMKI_16G2440 [Saccharomyces mikatae IFO 1815]CAI4036947.1 hypothetical protein SMKI_16G2440 [Saccharomyces mikatae IFO 1815]